MTIQAIADFYKVVEKNADVRERLVGVSSDEFAANAVRLGRELGFAFSEAEVLQLTDENYRKEDVWLTDEDLAEMGPGPHPCCPSGTGELELLALSLNLRESGRDKSP
jgi:hypothetical protein